MTATVPSYQHGKPWPIDNRPAPRGLDFRVRPTIDIKQEAPKPIVIPDGKARSSDDYMIRVKHALREAGSQDFKL